MTHEKRQFARICVDIAAGVQPVEEGRVDGLRREILDRPSVWALSSESVLRDLANSGSQTAEAVLARAVLDLTTQVVQLRAKLVEQEQEMSGVRLVQMSGGGGKIATELPLKEGDYFLIRFLDDRDDLPPIRAVGKIVWVTGNPSRSCGFRFDAIHPKDQDRVVRLIHRFQRQSLRRVRN